MFSPPGAQAADIEDGKKGLFQVVRKGDAERVQEGAWLLHL